MMALKPFFESEDLREIDRKMSNSLPNRFDIEIAQQGSKISSALHMLRSQQYPPDARKGLR